MPQLSPQNPNDLNAQLEGTGRVAYQFQLSQAVGPPEEEFVEVSVNTKHVAVGAAQAHAQARAVDVYHATKTPGTTPALVIAVV